MYWGLAGDKGVERGEARKYTTYSDAKCSTVERTFLVNANFGKPIRAVLAAGCCDKHNSK
jgi:hypothetical protein